MAKKHVTKDLSELFPETASQRILLEEFRLLSDRYNRTRDGGIARMNFFITAASVALGGVLVFGSDSNVPFEYFRLVLLVTLIVLAAIGLDVHNTLIQRDVSSDRYERSLARIRHYFVELDPDLKQYFIGSTVDVPTNYLSPKYSGMRRTAQIVESFIIGLVITLLSTFLPLTIEAYVLTGCLGIILIFNFLEANARRRFSLELRKAEKDTLFKA